MVLEGLKVETYITDERTGLKYELVGDHYLIAGENEPEERSIGVWGQRHLRYLKARRQAEELFLRLVNQMAAAEGITETLKAADQMEWIRRMNSVGNRAVEIVNAELIDL